MPLPLEGIGVLAFCSDIVGLCCPAFRPTWAPCPCNRVARA
jgi:hypothetical protein